MKNLTHFALALLLVCSCRKVSLLVTPGKVVPEKQLSSSIQQVGYVSSGTNITLKLKPFTFVTLRSRDEDLRQHYT